MPRSAYCSNPASHAILVHVTAPGTVTWVHQCGWILPKITEAQRGFGVELDRLLAEPDPEVFAAAVRHFSQTVDEARSLPPVPGRAESRLYRAALEGWATACQEWTAGGLETDSLRRGLKAFQAGTDAYSELGKQLAHPSHGLLRSINELWSNPKEAARLTASDPGSEQPDRRVSVPADPALPDRRVSVPGDPGAITIDLHSDSARAGGPGLVVAAFFGVAAWVPVISAIVGSGNTPAAALVVFALIGTLLLGAVAFLGIGQLRMRRATDRLHIDPVGISRTGQFIAFNVRWEQLRAVGVILGEAYRGETKPVPARLFARGRPSRMAIEFRPLDPQAFAHANPVLSTGPAHSRFAAMGAEIGCELGICTQRTIDQITAAVQHAAPRQWLGVRAATRR